MKKTMQYSVNGKTVERTVNYIPVRYILAIMITVLEVLAVIGVVVAFCYFVPYFYIAAWLTEIGCVIRIISSDDNPDYKVPWLLFVLILPIAGFMLYLLFSSRTLKRKFIRRLETMKAITYPSRDRELLGSLERIDKTAYSHARLLTRIADTHLFSDTKQTYFRLGEDMHAAMLRDLRNAERFIYMEYFIIEQGKMWDSILEILREKAAAGLEIKLVYDDIGCMSTLPGNYAKMLLKSNISATPFSRLRGNADSEFNNRSHRKITVIDGRIGYTGGINLADEYINEIERFGHWKDVAIRLEGEAVYELTRLFLIDYGINVRELPTPRADLFPPCPETGESGYLIPFGDGPAPLYRHRVAKSAIRAMLASAEDYFWMTSPYLIIDNDLCSTIENTALRGGDVKIIVPHIPDKRIVFHMTRSFYSRLMAAGVEIYEYTPGFIHAKSYLADGKTAIIGTVNLDYRSLVHHFENGVWMHRTASIKAIEADLRETLGASARVTDAMLKTNFLNRFFRAVVRILAPLL